MATELTPEEQQAIIDAVIARMQQNGTLGVREYIGARYVPVMANPIEWDNGREYEPLTIVIHEGNSYTSMQTVPTGIDISNTSFWALTGNYNAQVEQYRQDVDMLSEKLAGFDNKFENINTQLTTINNNIETIDSEVASSQADIMTLESITLLKDKTAVFLGDSITYGQDNSSTTGRVETTWPQAMANLLKFTATNVAVGGATAANYDPAPSTALEQAQAITTAYDYVFMMFGTNDYGYEVPLDDTYNGLVSAINNLIDKFQNMKIIGVIPPYMPGDTDPNSKGITALEYKMRCRLAYESKGIPYIDFSDGLGWNANNWDSKLMTWDKNLTRLHPNQAAYLEMGYYAASTFQVNGQNHEVNNWRNGQGKSIQLRNGATYAAESLPPLTFYDEMTKYLFVDLGDGIKIPDNYSVSNQPIGHIDSPYKPYRSYYTAAVLIAGETGVQIGCLSINNDGDVVPLGSASWYAGKTIIGSMTISFPWLIPA